MTVDTLSKRAQNALVRIGTLCPETIKRMPTRQLFVRGAGLKTVQEICRWAGREEPVCANGPSPSEKAKPMTQKERMINRYWRYLLREGFTIIQPSRSKRDEHDKDR